MLQSLLEILEGRLLVLWLCDHFTNAILSSFQFADPAVSVAWGNCLPPPGQTGRSTHYVLTLSWLVGLFVHSFVYYQTGEHDILKISELIIMSTCTSGPRIKRMNCQLWGLGGQRSRSHEDRFGGLAEASLCTTLAFLVYSYALHTQLLAVTILLNRFYMFSHCFILPLLQ